MSIPQHNLGKESGAWGNAIQRKIGDLEGVVARLGQSSVAKGLATLSQSVNSRFSEVAIQITNALATLTFSNIAGTLGQDRVTGTWDKDVNAAVVTGTTGTFTSATINGTLTQNGSISMNSTGDLFTPHGRATPVVSSFVAAYLNVDGRLGATTSRMADKQDIQPHSIPLEIIMQVLVVSYRRKAAIELLGDDAEWETGVIAEWMVEVGLSEYVIFDEDGKPFSVAYERLGLLALDGLQQVVRRLDAAGI